MHFLGSIWDVVGSLSLDFHEACDKVALWKLLINLKQHYAGQHPYGPRIKALVAD